MLNRARLWLHPIVLRRRLEREMQEEIAGHLERSIGRLEARGLSREEARREAEREFGNVAYLQEEGRYARGTRWLDSLEADTRFAIRHFLRRPGTTLTMFVVLAVGMSISTLLFSYVHSYAVRPPLAVPRADDLVRIRGSQDAGDFGRVSRGFSEEEFRGYRALTDHFRAVAGWTNATVSLDAGDDPAREGLEARATFVTEGYFSVLGVRPVVGVGLPAGDATLSTVAVLGYAAWEQLFGGDPAVVGSTVAVNGVAVTIVGVAPERFVGVGAPARLQLWMPLEAERLLTRVPPDDFRAVGRLRPGVGTDAAGAAVRVVAARAADADPALRDLDPSADVVPLLAANGDPMFDRDVRLMSFSIGLLGLLVLLVTCTNVSALLTGLASARRQEIAIRLSLGAARTRLIRQLLTESALLASAAAAAALGIVWVILRAVARFLPVIPLEMSITWQATLFTFGVALAVGIAFGLSPALHATRMALAGALRDSSASIAGARARLQRGLVVAQIALTQPLIVLLAAALLLVVGRYQPQERTADAERLVLLSLRTAPPAFGPDDTRVADRYRAATLRIAERLEQAPGVEAAVVEYGSTPALGAYFVDPADRVAGTPEQSIRLTGSVADEGYFRLVGIPVARGRGFTDRDAGPHHSRTGELPVILNADLAARLWGPSDPVGRRLRAATDSAAGATTLVVVGVVADPRGERRSDEEAHSVYLPPDPTASPRRLLLRTAGAAAPLLPALRELARAAAPGAVVQLRTLADSEEEASRNFRIATGGVLAAGLMALLLSAIGLYAVVAFSVGQRTGEIAIRMAMGARARQIARHFLADGLRLSAVGLAIGLPVSLMGLRLLVGAAGVADVALPSVTAIAATGVVLVAAAAAWIPARRAAAIDPAIALRRG